ncbi:MAG: acetate--CoA ligase family protein [Thermoplasmatota archaeon]
MRKNIARLLEVKGALAENEVKELLRSYMIPTTVFTTIKSKEDIERLKVKYPVALKICSRSILHKTDVGGVKLNIRDKSELLKTFDKFEKKFPGETFLVDEMAEKGVEMIIGLVQDPTFGLSIMCGVGGIYTELYQDVAFRVVPIDEYDAREMLEEVKGKKLLEGFRNMKANKELFIELLLKISKLGEELIDHIDQMDINPVFVYKDDVCVVDAKLILK